MIVRIHAHVITWNEERLIWHYLNHHLTFCQRVFVYDNHSTDRTVEIARSFGSRVEVIPFGDQFLNDDDYLKIKNEAWKKSDADFVIVGDCDEFIFAKDIASIFYRAKMNRVSVIPLKWFDMISDQSVEANRMIHDQIKTGVPNQGSKNLVFSPELITDINYGYGAHHSKPKGVTKIGNEFLTCLHYKYLGGVEAMISRHEAYKKRLSKNNLKKNLGSHYHFTREQNIEFWNNIKAHSQQVI